jgi:hypothetical protein
MRQPRLLPPPEELLAQGEPAPAYCELVAELLALGQSLHERQIQPIIVYPGVSAVYPAARYLGRPPALGRRHVERCRGP